MDEEIKVNFVNYPNDNQRKPIRITTKYIVQSPVQSPGPIKKEDTTCFTCPENTTCPFRFDAYNTNGDCLANK